ncbi:DNA ligase [Rhizoctonia solani]|uniref:DNA ligase n=1 Tax=Rhizoctonia solani TaxID=456999 RepID=A0A8H7HBJ6_9AGAM|nr:DNA ligase [Rhizoctonia solani]
MSLYFCRSPPPSLSSLILMPKRASSSVLSSKATKRSKTGDQKTIHSFFSSSSRSAVAKQENRELDLKTVIIDLCLEDECEGKQEFSASALAKEVQEDVLSAVPKSTYLAEGLAPQETESNQIKYIDPNASPLLFTPDLSSDPLEFPLSPCPWDARFPAPYAFLSYALVTLSSTRSRISITNTLVNTLRLLIRYDARQSLLPALYLLSNSVAPSYEGVELKIGPSTLNKAIQSVSGISSGTLKTMSNKLGKFSDIVVHFSLSLIRLEIGDPGDVAFEAKSSVRTLHPAPPLQLASVHANLLKISALKGQTSAKQKQSIVEKLLVAARGEEVRYLVRMLSLNLRVGAVKTTILTALGRALALTPPSGEELNVLGESRVKGKGKAKLKERDHELWQKMIDAETLVKQVYVRHPHFGHIVNAALDSGLEHLSDNVQLTVGIPLHPTLGSPTRSLDEIYDRLGDLAFTAEFKYDGQRVQVHASRNAEKVSIRLFSRHLEDMTQKYPDIVQMAQILISQSEGKLDSFILDAEVVAVDPHTGTIRTFQELSNRPRKGVSLKDVKATVCVYAFDLMYLNGEGEGQVLLDKAFRERRRLLRERFPPLTPEDPFCSRLAHAESVESEDGREAVEEFWERAVASQCEGLMIKLDSGEVFETTEKDGGPSKRRKKPLPATYEPDKRTSAWLKLKKDYVEGIGDSLDLVPIGGWHGIGRKAGWWSPILLGLWDANAGEFIGVCKCMSGFSDAFYKALNERYSEEAGTCSKTPYAGVNTNGLVPPAWFKPSEVWEIKGADITLSPISQASKGLVAGDRGLSLRFPRFIRVREDKALNDASTPEFLAGLWRKQGGKGGGADEGDLVDASSEEELAEEDELE